MRSVNDDADARYPTEAADFLMQGRKIEAIKVVREQLGLGLKEAHDLTQAYIARNPDVRRAMDAHTIRINIGMRQIGWLAALAAFVYILWQFLGE